MDKLIVVLLVFQSLLSLLIIVMLLNSGRNKDNAKSFSSLQDVFYRFGQEMKEELRSVRSENRSDAKSLRSELGQNIDRFNESIVRRMHENQGSQLAQLDAFAKQLERLTQMNEIKLEKLRASVESKLQEIQMDNSRKLEAMRQTVDEKLNDTLEKRLGESFRLVSERLEQVHKGLGEMQTLAAGVGDLKRVLSNVKTRGIWGEIQLGSLLEQLLAPEQYAENIATVPGSSERVEFAVKLPGRNEAQNCVWLPIDAKFPQEDYQRFLQAQEAGDKAAAIEAGKALEIRVKSEAKDIKTKYISVPYTTEFAILFLPIEGLYAEVLRRSGLCEELMHTYKIVIAGPTTLAALLNSLQMGFRTIAIEKRSAEVWTVLGAVKTEFGKFGDLLDKTQKKLQEASNSIDTASRKSRTIERKLKSVQELPQVDAQDILITGNDQT